MAELKIISMDEVQSKEVNWLWYPYIPYGKITIIQGDPGEGKTTLALRLAALLSKGEPLPYDTTEREPVKIIYQTAEDGLEDTIKPRLEAAEADCTQIKVIDESEAALSMLDDRIEKAIIEVGARVVILDPIQAYVGANINMNNANEVRSVMAQLGKIAEKYDCAVLLVGHMNKGSGNKSSYRGLGSIDFQASARSVLIVGRIKDNPQVRVMVQDKSSLAPEGEAIAFELDKENGFSWLGHYDISVAVSYTHLICLGMQIAVMEFARHVCGLEGASSTEIDPDTPYPVIDIMEEQKGLSLIHIFASRRGPAGGGGVRRRARGRAVHLPGRYAAKEGTQNRRRSPARRRLPAGHPRNQPGVAVRVWNIGGVEMSGVSFDQVEMWMEHLSEDSAPEEQEEAVRGLIEYVQNDERRETRFLQKIFLGGDGHVRTRHNAARVVAALDDDIIEYYAPLCLCLLYTSRCV